MTQDVCKSIHIDIQGKVHACCNFSLVVTKVIVQQDYTYSFGKTFIQIFVCGQGESVICQVLYYVKLGR